MDIRTLSSPPTQAGGGDAQDCFKLCTFFVLSAPSERCMHSWSSPLPKLLLGQAVHPACSLPLPVFPAHAWQRELTLWCDRREGISFVLWFTWEPEAWGWCGSPDRVSM